MITYYIERQLFQFLLGFYRGEYAVILNVSTELSIPFRILQTAVIAALAARLRGFQFLRGFYLEQVRDEADSLLLFQFLRGFYNSIDASAAIYE